MEKIPVAGEKFDYGNLHITVTRSTPKRVAEVQITVEQEDEEKSERKHLFDRDRDRDKE